MSTFLALSFLVFGIVSTAFLRPFYIQFMVSCLVEKPAALILKEGVVRPRRQAGAAEKEQSIYRSSMFIRLVIACFVVSYPFFIPAFVSPCRDWFEMIRAYIISTIQNSLYLNTVRSVRSAFPLPIYSRACSSL